MRQSQYGSQPAPDFEKNDLQLRISFQSAAADQAQAREHLLDRMGDRVGKKPLAGETVGARRGQKSAGAFVNQERHAELDDGFVKRVVIGVVDIAAFHRIGPHEDAFEAKLVDRAFGFVDGELYILHGNHADAHQAMAVFTAVIVKPIIIRTAQRCGVGFLLHRRQIQSRRGKQQAALDAVAVHGHETLLWIGC